MRAVIQRVRRGRVAVDGETVGEIGHGLVALIGVAEDDALHDARYIVDKIAGLRVFEDRDGKMNLSVKEIGGGVLAVSQFTLLGDVRKGRRPSFSGAAAPERAEALYLQVADLLEEQGIPVALGRFRAHMQVELLNDGPVTILLDSRRLF
ncbi:MAG TPA: D-tyrosyl-tRNA(Tyr) deacylase [Armatimonadetes bacterium]|nr:D-tyrosyl-tRNA(Tyr) deacylase [Armatimonadota bacterium]